MVRRCPRTRTTAQRRPESGAYFPTPAGPALMAHTLGTYDNPPCVDRRLFPGLCRPWMDNYRGCHCSWPCHRARSRNPRGQPSRLRRRGCRHRRRPEVVLEEPELSLPLHVVHSDSTSAIARAAIARARHAGAGPLQPRAAPPTVKRPPAPMFGPFRWTASISPWSTLGLTPGEGEMV